MVISTAKGLFCTPGNFYIDPWQPVDYAVITHAHSDHARAGSRHYLCHHHTKPLLQLRLGDCSIQTLTWNEKITINGVTVSLHPAGHIIGSSQVRLEYNGEVCVINGDYKTEDDGISGAFEPVACHTFVTESTFGLPIYHWRPQQVIFHELQNWVRNNQVEERCSVIIGYSLGKAQRVLKAMEEVTGNVFAHGAIWNVHQALVQAGFSLPPLNRVLPQLPKEIYKGAVILAPPSALGSTWMNRFTPYRTAICSGWMQVRGHQRRSNADAGFALSDHADWNGLLDTVKATGAEKVLVTHGFQSAFSRYLNELGIAAEELKTEYGDTPELDAGEASDNPAQTKTLPA